MTRNDSIFNGNSLLGFLELSAKEPEISDSEETQTPPISRHSQMKEHGYTDEEIFAANPILNFLEMSDKSRKKSGK